MFLTRLKTFTTVATKDFLKVSNNVISDEGHIKASIDWLLKSFYATNQLGSAASFSLRSGWGIGYPETTGYIIPTLLNCLSLDYKKEKIIKTCEAAGEWLLNIQNKDGSFNGYNSKSPFVFDTGQVLFGLAALYKFTKNKKYLDALNAASNWLVERQESDGSWVRRAFNNKPHAYYSRVSWGLLVSHQLTKNDLYKAAAVKNLDWVYGQQQSNGWFNGCGFFSEDEAVLHTIAYTLQGLLESGVILKNNKYIEAVKKSADILLGFNSKSLVLGFYDCSWRPVKKSLCLTGLAQMGIVWSRLYEIFNNGAYFNEVDRIIHYLKERQNIKTKNQNIGGGIAGSFPIWGNYLPFSYPNWANKFFIDLMLLSGLRNNNITLSYVG